jgi:hypothetical protein
MDQEDGTFKVGLIRGQRPQIAVVSKNIQGLPLRFAKKIAIGL